MNHVNRRTLAQKLVKDLSDPKVQEEVQQGEEERGDAFQMAGSRIVRPPKDTSAAPPAPAQDKKTTAT